MSSLMNLSIKQVEVLNLLREARDTGRPTPSVREMCQRLGLASTRAVCDRLDALERKGWIRRNPGHARSITLVDEALIGTSPGVAHVPLMGIIPAGKATDVVENTEVTLSVDVGALGYQPSKRDFALKVQGNSMTGRGIFDGDIVIMDGAAEPRDGDIVAALIDNCCTLKTLVKTCKGVFLRPENPEFEELIPTDSLSIQGVARAVFRRL